MAEVQRRLSTILSKPSNKTCADCDSKNPRWASLSLGVLVCIRCCGHHRNLGTHISKMKSVTLDKWQPEWCLIFERLDNEGANKHWEGRKPASVKKPLESSSSAEVERYLRDKYEFKRWTPLGEDNPVEAVLKGTYRAASAPERSPVVTEKPSSPSQQPQPFDLLALEESSLKEEEFTWHSPPEPPLVHSTSLPHTTFPAFSVSPPAEFPVPSPSVPISSTEANIKAILSMYQHTPAPHPVSSSRPEVAFKPLGAIAAEQFLRRGQASVWPSSY